MHGQTTLKLVHIYKGIPKGHLFIGFITTSSLTNRVYNNLIHVLLLQYITGYHPCNKLTFCIIIPRKNSPITNVD